MWQPNQEFVEALLCMGISQHAAERALLHTGNTSADLAAAWVFDNLDAANQDKPLLPEEIESQIGSGSVPIERLSQEKSLGSSEEGEEEEDEEELPEGYNGPYKMVFIVNMQLKMGVGKIAAQVGHATMGLHRYLINKEIEEKKEMGPLSYYSFDGEKKIALKGESTQHLRDLRQQAIQSGIACYLVTDAGHTQVAPGSKTVLSIFGREADVDQLTGKLKLL